MQCLAGETGHFRLLFCEVHVSRERGRWELEASSSNVHFFIYQTPCGDGWSWGCSGFHYFTLHAVFVLCSLWECIDLLITCPQHKPDWPLLWWCNCCCCRWWVDWVTCSVFYSCYSAWEAVETGWIDKANQTLCFLLSETFICIWSSEGPAVDRRVSNGIKSFSFI